MSYQLTIGRYQLVINFGRKRGRPKKTLITLSRELAIQLLKLAKDRRRAGQPLSRVFRYLFEFKKVKKIFGLNLAILIFFTGLISTPLSAFSTYPETELANLNPQLIKLTTESSVRLPLDSFEITQGYHLFHRAIDLNEKQGAPVYPLMDGKIEAVYKNHFAYGNYLIINHGSGFKSLYAHLAKILVKPGEEVDKNTVIGLVGATGWATGSHLHLEVYDNGRPFNPLTILR